MKAVAVAFASLVFAAIPSFAHADPIRTMVYHYDIDARGFGSVPNSDSFDVLYGNGVSGFSGAHSGEITVTVVRDAPDGGLVVDVGETIDRTLRPLQTVRCAIYGATSDVLCDQNIGATAEEAMLLSYIDTGRQSLDPSRLATKHWQSVPLLQRWAHTVHDVFTVDKVEGQVITIGVDRELRTAAYRTTTTGSLIYDASIDAADSMKLETATTRSHGDSDINFECRLVSDSAAESPSPNPH